VGIYYFFEKQVSYDFARIHCISDRPEPVAPSVATTVYIALLHGTLREEYFFLQTSGVICSMAHAVQKC
jgi:hypothetical protein